MSAAVHASQVTPPAAPLWTLAELKKQCEVEHDLDNDYLEALGAVAETALSGPETVYRQGWINQVWQDVRPSFPCATDPLTMAPVTSIEAITYMDSAGAVQSVPGSDFYLAFSHTGGHVRLAPDASWPTDLIARDDAVTIEYAVGFGAGPEDVPATVRHALLLLVGHYYRHREAVILTGAPKELPQGVAALMQPFRRF